MNQLQTSSLAARVNLGSLAVSPAVTGVNPTLTTVATVAPVQPALTKATTPVVTAVPVKTASLAVKIDQVRFIDPALAKAIADIPFETTGTPRSQLTVPLCPVLEVTDQVLFEEAADTAKKRYLPCYRLAQHNVSGQAQYRASLGQSGDGWALTLYLEKYPAPELGLASRDAQELAHQVALIFQYVIAGSGGIQKELLFQEVTQEAGFLRAVLQVHTLPERDELFRALTRDDYKPALLVRRTIKVAIAVEPPKTNSAGTGPVGSPRQPRAIPQLRAILAEPRETDSAKTAPIRAPQSLRVQGIRVQDLRAVPTEPRETDSAGTPGSGTLRGTWMFNFDTSTEGTAGDVWWEQQTETARRLVPHGLARLAFLGAVNFDEITLNRLQGLNYDTQPLDGSTKLVAFVPRPGTFGVSVMIPDDSSIGAGNLLATGNVFAVLTNGGNYAKVKVLEYGYNLKLQWVTYERGPLFREVTRVLDATSSPFLFDRDLHKYMFSDVSGVAGQGEGVVRWTVEWKNATHNYYQEVSRPNVFRSVADGFKLVRRPQSPHDPLMALHFDSPDGSPERMQVTLEYTAFKYEDADRLAHAAKELRKMSGVEVPVFLPLSAEPSQVKFSLALPQADGSRGPLVPREGVIINTQLALKDSLTVPYLGTFDAIWDAMHDATGAAVLFQGQVEVSLGNLKETIPFIGRMNDMVGELFDYTQVPDEASGGLQVVLRHAIESPVKIKNIAVDLSRGAQAVPGHIQKILAITSTGTKESLPLELGPTEEMRLLVAPAAPVPGSDPLEAVFDLDEVEVVPDREQILKKIVYRQQPEYTKTITVKTQKEWFQTPAGQEADPIIEVLIAFERGETITLTEHNCEGATVVHFPLLDVMAQKQTPEEYRYGVTVVRKSGIHEGQMQTSIRDPLWIDPRGNLNAASPTR